MKNAIDALTAVEATIHPSLNVYRWWRADMQLPAVWNWLTPGDTETPPVGGGDMAGCRVRDLLRVTVSIGVDPTAVAGEGDMLEIEEYADLAIPLLNAAVYSRNPLDQREARRRGGQVIADQLGDASILTIELPIEVYLDYVTPAP